MNNTGVIRFSYAWLCVAMLGVILYITDIRNTYFSKWMIITGLVMFTIGYYVEKALIIYKEKNKW